MARDLDELERQVRVGLQEATQRWQPDTDAARAELRRRIADSRQRGRRRWRWSAASIGGALTAAVSVATMALGVTIIPQVLPGTATSVDVRDGAEGAHRVETGNFCCGDGQASPSFDEHLAERCRVPDGSARRPTDAHPAPQASDRPGCAPRNENVEHRPWPVGGHQVEVTASDLRTAATSGSAEASDVRRP